MTNQFNSPMTPAYDFCLQNKIKFKKNEKVHTERLDLVTIKEELYELVEP